MRTLKSYVIALVAVAVIGIDGMVVNAEQAYIDEKVPILVKEFTTQDTQVKGDNSKDADKVAAKKIRVSQKLVNQIVEQLTEKGFSASPYIADFKASKAIILDGDISLIHNGSGSARVWIGFGAGKAKMIGTFKLYYADAPSTILMKEKIKAASIGAAGVFGGGGNREDAVNRNFARKVATLLEDTKVNVKKSGQN